MNTEKRRLIWNAVPTVFNVPNPPQNIANKRRSLTRKTEDEPKNKKTKPVPLVMIYLKTMLQMNQLQMILKKRKGNRKR